MLTTVVLGERIDLNQQEIALWFLLKIIRGFAELVIALGIKGLSI